MYKLTRISNPIFLGKIGFLLAGVEMYHNVDISTMIFIVFRVMNYNP